MKSEIEEKLREHIDHAWTLDNGDVFCRTCGTDILEDWKFVSISEDKDNDGKGTLRLMKKLKKETK